MYKNGDVNQKIYYIFSDPNLEVVHLFHFILYYHHLSNSDEDLTIISITKYYYQIRINIIISYNKIDFLENI